MATKGSGLPTGRPPTGGHSPEAYRKAAAEREAAHAAQVADLRQTISDLRQQLADVPAEFKPFVDNLDPRAVRKLWEAENKGPRWHPPAPKGKVRIVHPTGSVAISHPGVTTVPADPGAVHVPHEAIETLQAHGFKVEH